MPTLEYRYIPDGPFLLTPDEEAKAQASLETLQIREEEYKRGRLPEEATECGIARRQLQREIEENAELAGREDVRTLSIPLKEPTVADLDAVQNVLAGEPNRPDRAAAEAFSRLAEKPEDVPLRLMIRVRDACFRALFPDLSEERKVFTIRSRSR